MAILTDFQFRCCKRILQGLNEQAGLDFIARGVKNNRLAVSSAMRSLERRGLAGHFASSNQQWTVQVWFLTDELTKQIRGGRCSQT